MSFQISFSPKSAFVILLVLFPLTSGEKVLIMCTEGCGCVTELGKPVNCPFIRSHQTAVLLTKLRRNDYVATRIIPLGTVFDFQISTMNSLNAFCPDAAGIAPNASLSICVPAAKSVRTVRNSLVGNPEDSDDCKTKRQCVIEGGGPNAVVEFYDCGDEPPITGSEEPMLTAQGTFGSQRRCVPMMLRKR